MTFAIIVPMLQFFISGKVHVADLARARVTQGAKRLKWNVSIQEDKIWITNDHRYGIFRRINVTTFR